MVVSVGGVASGTIGVSPEPSVGLPDDAVCGWVVSVSATSGCWLHAAMAIDVPTVRTARIHFIFPPGRVLDDIGRTLFVITFVVLVGGGGFCSDLRRRRRVELQEQDIDFLWSRGYARSVGATARTLCRRCRRLGCLDPSTRQRMLAFRGTFLVLNAGQRG